MLGSLTGESMPDSGAQFWGEYRDTTNLLEILEELKPIPTLVA